MAVSSVRMSVVIRGRPRVEDPGFTTEIIGVHTVYAGDFEHELTMCHDGLTKDYHGVSRWYYDCTVTFPF